jgi:hypothetical protein
LKSNVSEIFSVSSIMEGHNGQTIFFVGPTLKDYQCDLRTVGRAKCNSVIAPSISLLNFQPDLLIWWSKRLVNFTCTTSFLSAPYSVCVKELSPLCDWHLVYNVCIKYDKVFLYFSYCNNKTNSLFFFFFFVLFLNFQFWIIISVESSLSS